MLPSFLDLSTMNVVMYIVIAISVLVGFMIIKTGEKPMLRVVTVGIIVVVCIVCYAHIRQFNDCQENGTTCTFLSIEVPQDGGFIN